MEFASKSTLQRMLRKHRIVGRSKLKTRDEMIDALRGSLAPGLMDTYMCAAGPYYPLKSVLPPEVVSKIVNIIRLENKWWGAVTKRDLERLYRVVVITSTPGSMCKQSLRAVLRKYINDHEEAQKVLATLDYMLIRIPTTRGLANLRHEYIKKNVRNTGLRFLITLSEDVLMEDLKVCGVHPRGLTFCDKWAMVNTYSKFHGVDKF